MLLSTLQAASHTQIQELAPEANRIMSATTTGNAAMRAIFTKLGYRGVSNVFAWPKFSDLSALPPLSCILSCMVAAVSRTLSVCRGMRKYLHAQHASWHSRIWVQTATRSAQTRRQPTPGFQHKQTPLSSMPALAPHCVQIEHACGTASTQRLEVLSGVNEHSTCFAEGQGVAQRRLSSGTLLPCRRL